MLTSHPADARYHSSRAAARADCGPGEKVIRLGNFAAGSFGCWPPRRPSGGYVGQHGLDGYIPGIIVWMVTAKK